jgi:hypothetical protein
VVDGLVTQIAGARSFEHFAPEHVALSVRLRLQSQTKQNIRRVEGYVPMQYAAFFADLQSSKTASYCPPATLSSQWTATIYYVRFQVLTAASVKMTVFWDVTLCSLVEVYRRFRAACCLPAIALTMEEACSSETSVNFYQTTRRIIPKDSHLQNLVYFEWHEQVWAASINEVLNKCYYFLPKYRPK